MSVAHLFEDFTEVSEAEPVVVTDVMLEEHKLAAFETGYQAGWDDCTTSAKETEQHLSEDFARNLRDLSFTYHEAYAAVLGDLRPILTQLVDTVLPQTAQQTLGTQMIDLIETEIRKDGLQPVQISAASTNIPPLKAMLAQADQTLPVKLSPNNSLNEGQLHLRIGDDREHEVNLHDLTEDIRQAVDGFFQHHDHTRKEPA